MSLDAMELLFGRYNGGLVAPVGSYVNLRNQASPEYFQQTSDGTLPADGTFYRTNPLGTESTTTIAATINTALGTTYVAGSLHVAAGGDHVTSQGQASDDA